MKHVSDRLENPFGMLPPPAYRATDGGPEAVFGYGDPAADFHVIGDHPGVHGGSETGIPFSGPEGAPLRRVLAEVGLLDDDGPTPTPNDCFLSYVHMARPRNGTEPTEAEYDDHERFFDAELRAINAHILIPVGERAIRHVVETYTAQRRRLDDDLESYHAGEIRGRGFLVVPVRDLASWREGDAEALRERLSAILASDYRQTKGVATLVG